MLTPCSYGNKLPRKEHPLTDKQIKKCIFTSFSLPWQHQYIQSGQQVASTPLSNIIKFMSNKKIFADAQNTAINANNKNESFSNKDCFGDFPKKRKGTGKQKYLPKHSKDSNSPSIKPDTECPIHGGHPWVKCFDNPHGNSFKT